MSLTEKVQAELRRANEDEQADRNAKPPQTVSNQNGEEAEEGMHGGGEPPTPREHGDAEK